MAGAGSVGSVMLLRKVHVRKKAETAETGPLQKLNLLVPDSQGSAG